MPGNALQNLYFHTNLCFRTTPGVLYAVNSVCSNGLLVTMTFAIGDSEYMDFKTYLPLFTVVSAVLSSDHVLEEHLLFSASE